MHSYGQESSLTGVCLLDTINGSTLLTNQEFLTGQLTAGKQLPGYSAASLHSWGLGCVEVDTSLPVFELYKNGCGRIQ